VAPAAARRRRDLLVVGLALITGATDATAFERLGHVFASVITGNLILLAVSSVSGDRKLLLFAGCAIAGYALGVVLGAPKRDEQDRGRLWPRAVYLALAFEGTLLIAFAVVWELTQPDPSEVLRIVLIALGAGAMGVQSTAVRRLGGMSTTYLTSTLTWVFEELARGRWSAIKSRSVGILGAALVGAGIATALILHAAALVPALQLLPLAAVLGCSRPLLGLAGA
jgi:uncharacterized membrane protein YoaK (UPF0700 family)